MTASKFVAEVKKQHGATIKMVKGRAAVVGIKKVPTYLKVAIAGHRPALKRWLVDRVDSELAPSLRSNDQLEALGFVKIIVGERYDGWRVTQKFAWTHPDGDHVLDAMLCGLLDPTTVAADAKAREDKSKRAEWAASHPARRF